MTKSEKAARDYFSECGITPTNEDVQKLAYAFDDHAKQAHELACEEMAVRCSSTAGEMPHVKGVDITAIYKTPRPAYDKIGLTVKWGINEHRGN
jgi:hypothetical protein